MSHDLRVWSVAPCAQDSALDMTGRGWRLSVSPSQPVLIEDVPVAVARALPGITHLTEVRLEGSRTPAAESHLVRVARRLAKAHHGVVEDPQEGTVETPRGVKRWVAPSRDVESVPLLAFHWWCAHPGLLERATLESFLGTLRDRLPEALPRRYGDCEPPRHQLAKMGHAHLIDYLLDQLDEFVVLYPSSPVASLSISTHREALWTHRFGRPTLRAHCIRLSIEESVLAQPGWAHGLRGLWRELSVALQPFYGDVRTLRGHLRSSNGRWWSNGRTEAHPIRSWWWSGVPRALGLACVIGSPYLDVWPRFEEQAEKRGSLAFLSTSDWSLGEDVADGIGGVPAALVQPADAENAPPPYTYPPLFPFPQS